MCKGPDFLKFKKSILSAKYHNTGQNALNMDNDKLEVHGNKLFSIWKLLIFKSRIIFIINSNLFYFCCRSEGVGSNNVRNLLNHQASSDSELLTERATKPTLQGILSENCDIHFKRSERELHTVITSSQKHGYILPAQKQNVTEKVAQVRWLVFRGYAWI